MESYDVRIRGQELDEKPLAMGEVAVSVHATDDLGRCDITFQVGADFAANWLPGKRLRVAVEVDSDRTVAQ